jgi:hypothetical protein
LKAKSRDLKAKTLKAKSKGYRVLTFVKHQPKRSRRESSGTRCAPGNGNGRKRLETACKRLETPGTPPQNLFFWVPRFTGGGPTFVWVRWGGFQRLFASQVVPIDGILQVLYCHFIDTLLLSSRGPHCHNHNHINSQINSIRMK